MHTDILHSHKAVFSMPLLTGSHHGYSLYG